MLVDSLLCCFISELLWLEGPSFPGSMCWNLNPRGDRFRSKALGQQFHQVHGALEPEKRPWENWYLDSIVWKLSTKHHRGGREWQQTPKLTLTWAWISHPQTCEEHFSVVNKLQNLQPRESKTFIFPRPTIHLNIKHILKKRTKTYPDPHILRAKETSHKEGRMWKETARFPSGSSPVDPGGAPTGTSWCLQVFLSSLQLRHPAQ